MCNESTAKRQPVALFVQKRSVYKTLGLDAYDINRNALTYNGDMPVIAHPPCQLWSRFAPVNFKRWGGDHNRPGNDGGLFEFALNTVRRCGGVLEHPAQSKAWDAYGLSAPTALGWQRTIDGSWVCEVWQSAYGHKAAKATWLYYIGVHPPTPLLWERLPGTHRVGYSNKRGMQERKLPVTRHEASATPISFAKALIELAVNSQE